MLVSLQVMLGVGKLDMSISILKVIHSPPRPLAAAKEWRDEEELSRLTRDPISGGRPADIYREDEYEDSDPDDEGVAHVSLRSPHLGFPSCHGWGLHRGGKQATPLVRPLPDA